MPVRRNTAPTAEASVSVEPDDVVAGLEPENEDEAPRHEGIIGSGWKDAEKLKESGGEYAKDFKFSETEQLAKFLQDEPFAVYSQHWITRDGKQSFTCIGAKECPLCLAGDKPRKMYAFNLVVIDGENDVELKSLTAGSRLLSQLEALNKSKRGPLSKHYWRLSRSGSRSAGYTYNFIPVLARDLEEDDIDEAVLVEELAQVQPYGPSIINVSTKAQLREIAEELD